MSVIALVLVTVLVAGAACVQGAAGFGMALLAAPLLTLVDRSFAPAPLVLAVLPLSVLVAQRDWAHLDRRGLAWAIGGRLPGVVLGAVAAAALSEHTLALVLGLGRARRGRPLDGHRPPAADAGHARVRRLRVRLHGHDDLDRWSTDGARLPAQ